MSEWQDISTAPRDGSWFWGEDNGDAILMRWHDEFQGFVASWREMSFSLNYGGGKKLHSPDRRSPDWWMPRVDTPARANVDEVQG